MTTPERIEPRTVDGFRERGAQVTRLEAFVDAAFAFAVTLLVISIDSIPQSLDELLQALKGVPAFAASFAQLALFWYLHVRWSRRFGLDDLPATLLSLALVFLVLVFVYPLKLLAGLFFRWVTGGWLPAPAELQGMSDLMMIFVVYGLMFASLSLCIARLYAHALRRHAVLGLSDEENAATAGDVASWHFATFVGLLSILLALLMPEDAPMWAMGAPGLVYILMNLSFWVDRWAVARTRRRLLAKGDP
jgi:uncharacterized membrane protein